MQMMRTFGRAVLGFAVATLMSVAPARAVDTVTIGTVGSPSANLWPLFIGVETVVPGHEHTSMSVITGQIPLALDTAVADGYARAKQAVFNYRDKREE